MEAVAQWLASQGGWGAWLLTVGFILWLILTGKIIHIRLHEARIDDLKSQNTVQVENLKEQLKDAQENEVFWREAATLSTEMGAIITKAKVSLERRQND